MSRINLLSLIDKTRLTALFLASIMFAATLIPTAAAYAQSKPLHRPDPTNPHMPDGRPNADKPMEQNYAPALEPEVAEDEAAADASPSVELREPDDFSGGMPLIREPLQEHCKPV